MDRKIIDRITKILVIIIAVGSSTIWYFMALLLAALIFGEAIALQYEFAYIPIAVFGGYVTGMYFWNGFNELR